MENIKKGGLQKVTEFFAVTKHSMFLVSDDGPVVRKVAKKGAISDDHIPVCRETRGDLVDITKHGIAMRLANGDSNRLASSIVALFPRKDGERALDCLNSDGLDCCDKRWQKETREVLAVIKSIPVFTLSLWGDLVPA